MQIGQEQRALAVAAAREAVACVPGADAARRILDLGGGPGLIGIALVQDRPHASGVVFDWPETAAVARRTSPPPGWRSAWRPWAATWPRPISAPATT
ncbi:hypothetical protein WJ972_03635 [Achromobacter insuavis]